MAAGLAAVTDRGTAIALCAAALSFVPVIVIVRGDTGVVSPPGLPAGVSARHVFPFEGAAAGVTARTDGSVLDVTVRTAGATTRVVSTDAGKTFAAAAPAGAPAGSDYRIAAVSKAAQGAGYWQLDWTHRRRPLTFAWSRLAPGSAPSAAIESCGLVAAVGVEAAGDAWALKLRRYLPTAGGHCNTRPIASLELARVGGDVRPALVTLPAAAVVAWPEGRDLHVLRVELPELMCLGGRPAS